MEPEEIQELASAPQSTTTAGVSVTERSANDTIALDKYAAQKRATNAQPGSAFVGLRLGVISPPGAQGD